MPVLMLSSGMEWLVLSDGSHCHLSFITDKTGHFCILRLISFAEIHTWAMCPIHYNLFVLTPSLHRSLDPCGSHWDTWVLLDSPNTTCRPWWARSLALGLLVVEPLSNNVAFFCLCYVEHTGRLKVELLEVLVFHRHVQGSNPLSPTFLDFPMSLRICELHTFNSSFHPERGWKVSTLGLITSSLYPFLLSIIPQGFKEWIFLLPVCQELSLCSVSSSFLRFGISSPFLGAVMADEVLKREPSLTIMEHLLGDIKKSYPIPTSLVSTYV